jgi:hypothetical protein
MPGRPALFPGRFAAGERSPRPPRAAPEQNRKPRGYGVAMTEDPRIDTRSHLLPGERAAGSDDPREQAKAILEESDRRTEDPEATKRESTQTPD